MVVRYYDPNKRGLRIKVGVVTLIIGLVSLVAGIIMLITASNQGVIEAIFYADKIQILGIVGWIVFAVGCVFLFISIGNFISAAFLKPPKSADISYTNTFVSGEKANPQSGFCPSCGKEFHPGAEFCIYCGNSIKVNSTQGEQVQYVPVTDDRQHSTKSILSFTISLISLIAGTLGGYFFLISYEPGIGLLYTIVFMAASVFAIVLAVLDKKNTETFNAYKHSHGSAGIVLGIIFLAVGFFLLIVMVRQARMFFL